MSQPTTTIPPNPPTAEDDPRLKADLRALGQLIADSKVEEARVRVKELVARWPNSERVKHFDKVLAPPIARTLPGVRGRSLDQDYAWYRNHAAEYPGCWLATYENHLVAAGPDLEQVLADVRERGVRDVLLQHSPGNAP